MGRSNEDELSAAQILYPLMQCADIFYLDAQICQLGVDQRKVNMLARDYCSKTRKKKPIVLSHHMLMGLTKNAVKMSKSIPDSAIFMEDPPEEVRRKITNAYCPSKGDMDKDGGKNDMKKEFRLVDQLENPILDYFRHLVFDYESEVTIGGECFSKAEDVDDAWLEGRVAEEDLKEVLIDWVIERLNACHLHFLNDPEAKKLLQRVESHKREEKMHTVMKDNGKKSISCPDTLYGSAHEKQSAKRTVVFCPRPENVTGVDDILLDDLLALMYNVKRAVAQESLVVLWIEDWTAYVLDCFEGDMENIRKYYQRWVSCITSLSPDLMERVSIKWQSEEILKSPREYFLQAIVYARKLTVSEIRKLLNCDLTQSSQVVASVLLASDVLGLCNVGDAHGKEVTVVVPRTHQYGIASHVCDYIQSDIVPSDLDGKIVAPSICTSTQHTSQLLPEVYVTEAPKRIRKRVQKMICVERVVENNAVLVALQKMAEVFIVVEDCDPLLCVKRKLENGGDKYYKNLDVLKADFGTGQMHPNDLKATLAELIETYIAGPIHAIPGIALKSSTRKGKPNVDRPFAHHGKDSLHEDYIKQVETYPLLSKHTDVAANVSDGASTASCYMGFGVTTSKGLSVGLPMDCLSMILLAERVVKRDGYKIIVLADLHAKSNIKKETGVTEESIAAKTEEYKQILERIIANLGLDRWKIIKASEMADDERYKELEREANQVDIDELRELETCDKDPSYAQRQAADTRYMVETYGVQTKIGWAKEKRGKHDEVSFDKISKRVFPKQLGSLHCLYTKAGKTSEGHECAPYTHCGNPDIRTLMMRQQTMKGDSKGYEKYITRLIESYRSTIGDETVENQQQLRDKVARDE